MRRILAIAGAVLLLSAGVVSAQQPAKPERSNKAGEVRGKERADQVKGMKTEKGKPEKAKADKAKKG